MDVESRLHDIERRLAALEAASSSADVGSVAATNPDIWWILQGLRDRIGQSRGLVSWAGRVETDDGPLEWQMLRDVDDLLDLDEHSIQEPADRLAALGHPTRLAIIAAIINGTTKVSELTEAVGLTTTGQLYHHLNTLISAGWVRFVRRGRVEMLPERHIPALVAMGVAA